MMIVYSSWFMALMIQKLTILAFDFYWSGRGE